MITRVRLEASSHSEGLVREELLDCAAQVKDWYGGQWELEEPDSMQVQTTSSGFWGRLTIRKVTR